MKLHPYGASKYKIEALKHLFVICIDGVIKRRRKIKSSKHEMKPRTKAKTQLNILKLRSTLTKPRKSSLRRVLLRFEKHWSLEHIKGNHYFNVSIFVFVRALKRGIEFLFLIYKNIASEHEMKPWHHNEALKSIHEALYCGSSSEFGKHFAGVNCVVFILFSIDRYLITYFLSEVGYIRLTLSYPILTYGILSYSPIHYPILKYFVLSWPKSFYPRISWLVLPHPEQIPSYPIQLCPILS